MKQRTVATWAVKSKGLAPIKTISRFRRAWKFFFSPALDYCRLHVVVIDKRSARRSAKAYYKFWEERDMTEKYLVIQTDGKLRWEDIPREKMLERLHEIIGCSCVEQVRTMLHNIVLIVDESGRIKDPPQQHNDLASCLYLGWILGYDDIVGPAVLATLRPVGPFDEMDWFPLSQAELDRLRNLGYEIPKKE